MTESVTANERNSSEAVTKAGDSQDEFVTKLAKIYQRLKYNKKLGVAMKEVEQELLDLLDVRLFTIYQSVDNGKDLVATIRGGDKDKIDDTDIRISFNTNSLAGYVASSQRALLVKDVNNANELKEIHPKLTFDSSFSDAKGYKVKSQIVVPIKDEILLGVFQLVNFEGDREFTRTDLKHAMMVTQVLAKQFRSSLQSTQGPYDYLVQKGKINPGQLADVQKKTSLYGGTVTQSLMEEFKIEADLIGKSLEFYYRVPYMSYDPELELPLDLLENSGMPELSNAFVNACFY